MLWLVHAHLQAGMLWCAVKMYTQGLLLLGVKIHSTKVQTGPAKAWASTWCSKVLWLGSPLPEGGSQR